MDFGLSRFLEMFEERFGRTATTALLAFIALALFAYCAKTLIDTSLYFYVLIIKALNITETTVLQAVIHITILVIEVLLAWLLLIVIWKFYFTPRIKTAMERAEDRHRETQELYDRTEKLLDQAQQRVDEVQRQYAELGTRRSHEKNGPA